MADLARRARAAGERLRAADPRASAGNRRDMQALAMLAPLATEYVPWSSAALRPSALLAILNDIVVPGRTTIVECGGGISTLFIGRALAQRGDGRLLTIEHDPR